MPNDPELHRHITSQHHDTRVAGHLGHWKTLELVSRNYWWPQMSHYIGQYVKTCDPCLWTKIQCHRPTGELHPLPTPESCWDVISVDFIVELPDSHGYDAVMNVVDSVGKRAHFIPTNTTITALGAARLFLHNVWKLHGLPRHIVPDRGPQFMAEFTWELYRMLGITLSTTTAYHPQVDRQTEHVNQELEQYLRVFVNEHQDDWDELLQSSSHLETVNEFTDRMQSALTEVKSALAKAQDDMSRYYNRRQEPALEYAPRDEVYLDGSDIRTSRPSKKLVHHFLGPYVVEHRVRANAYRLCLPKSMSRLHPIFPVVKLLTAPPDLIPGWQSHPPPDPVLVDGEEEYEVEAVINSCLFRGRLQYLIQWKGYSYEHNSWEDAMDVHSPELVAGFYSAHPRAPHRVRRAHFDYISFQSSQDRRARSSLPRGGVM